ASGRQRSHLWSTALEHPEYCRSARRNRRYGLVVRVTGEGSCSRPISGYRSLPGGRSYALAACHDEVFLRGGDPVERANHDGHLDSSLCSRRPWVLRLPVGPLPALCSHAHLAPATRHLLDRDFLASNGPVRWASGDRT